MKKIFRYVQDLWIGEDGKVSIKRSLALTFSIHIMLSVTSQLRAYVKLVHLAFSDKNLVNADMITAAGASLGSLATVIGIEAALVAALLGLTSYQSIQLQKNKKPADETAG